ncbi:uncharacterized protein [Rutidosis leptorrhynchoides]|uniref:uncharacterized protein n=1 Tax=Rutidosis leptorrhynchoides TaxID=125765 RepID=UPI003A99C638
MGRTADELITITEDLMNVRINQESDDKWSWSLDSEGTFKVKTLSLEIDKCRLQSLISTKTLCNKGVPQKIGIYVWRTKLKRIPVHVELDTRGIDLDSILYPLCTSDSESIEHITTKCPRVLNLWHHFFKWWNTPPVNNFLLEQSFDDSFPYNDLSTMGKLIWQCAKWVCSYHILKARNNLIFKGEAWNAANILSNIQLISFGWISRRLKKASLDWNQWLINPGFYILSTNIRTGIG